jgi:hypothetical protein
VTGLANQLAARVSQAAPEVSGKSFNACIIARRPGPAPADDPKIEGIFWPLCVTIRPIAARSGDFTNVAKLMTWVEKSRCNIVSTLPLLAAFMRDEREISLFPVSRLLLERVYIEATKAPSCGAAAGP